MTIADVLREKFPGQISKVKGPMQEVLTDIEFRFGSANPELLEPTVVEWLKSEGWRQSDELPELFSKGDKTVGFFVTADPIICEARLTIMKIE